MKSTDLKEAIQQTSFATSEKETRPVLTGVNFKAKNHVLECACDRCSLSFSKTYFKY